MGLENYKYITKDALYLPDNDAVIVRGKRIDISRVYQHIFGREMPGDLCEMLEATCQKFCNDLSPCQNDLLRLEFGEKEMTLDEACPMTNLLTDNPVDANVKKLDEAVAILRVAMKAVEYNSADIDAELDEAYWGGYQQANEEILAEQAEAEGDFEPFRCLVSCISMLGACGVSVLAGYRLAKRLLDR